MSSCGPGPMLDLIDLVPDLPFLVVLAFGSAINEQGWIEGRACAAFYNTCTTNPNIVGTGTTMDTAR
jgi:hypothetical protein